MSKILLFNGLDASTDQELWSTNGALTGAVEITPSLSASQGGLNPLYLTPFNGGVLFQGTNSSGVRGLWFTNGTSAGTYELTGISGANPTGLIPSDLTVYNGVVLFQGFAGVAGNNVGGLWETNGTAAGTFEIGGVANANIANISSGGLIPGPPNFTPFNGVVLFSGRDAAGNQGLWETNGTASGTFELGPIAGAAFGPGFSSTPEFDIQPRYMAVLGNEVIFDGADQQDTPGSLWVTDGTTAGTVEIGGQGNAGVAGSPNGFTGQFTSELPIGIVPTDLTTFNGKALFAGTDNTINASGYYAHTDALWVSDGTAAGTVEIGGLGNAQVTQANPALQGGIFWSGSIAYPDFTPLGNIALFVGYDSIGHVGLWETDGSAAGTQEIGGLGNAGVTGGLSLLGSQTPDFTVYNGKVYFWALDSSNQSRIWVTDGTAAGTKELTTPASLGLPNTVLGPGFTAYGKSTSYDFYGSGTSDLVWQSQSSGSVWEWTMAGAQHTNSTYLGGLSGWLLAGSGDFYGNGTADLVWQNTADGSTWEWEMMNGQPQGNLFLGYTNGFTALTGDFNGNGTSDLLWFNASSGATWIWTMTDGAHTGNTFLGSEPGWTPSVGDFNGDGTSDILWQNQTTGQTWEWQVQGEQDVNSISLGYTNGYKVVGTGDFYGNGTDDVIWQNTTAGDVWEWTMSNGQHTGSTYLGNELGWSVVGIGDYSGGAASDIVWQNSTTGSTWEWTMSNGQHSGSIFLGTLSGWQGQ
jgi:hypothetical protein